MNPQSILPVVTPENRLYGIVSIPVTTFTGLETTFALPSGQTAPVTRKTYTKSGEVKGSPKVLDYMAIQISNTDVRKGFDSQYTPFVGVNDLVQALRRWMVIPGITAETVRGDGLNSVLSDLLNGVNVPVPSPVPVPPTPTPTAMDATIRYTLAYPFANAPACSFFEINWVNDFAVQSGNLDPASISFVNVPVAFSQFVKSYVVQSPTSSITPSGGVQNNSLRFIRIGNLNPASGSYNIDLLITNTAGSTVPVVLTVVVP